MVNKIVVVYALIDPITCNPFYVGATRCTLKGRLSQHINDGVGGNGCMKAKLDHIEAIIKSGHYPIIKPLRKVEIHDVDRVESFYYRKFLRQGHVLHQTDRFGYSIQVPKRRESIDRLNKWCEEQDDVELQNEIN